ncbi:hypothetical protein F383_38115 [Gossypium arboreum]|uniref:Uncharacterized protein n=1 Tax=Gossypium arboreum TaxID=29729 RepID=A0A0B0MEW7_GOSAR|nr:hypothetical protein F383_38115 [Gossypium arboreum]
MVLHVITYRCHCPKQGLTHTHISKSYVMRYLIHIRLVHI